MAVYRVNKNRGYTVMANYHLRDKTLSLKAVGLLSKMLSFNDGWQFSTKGLSAICKEGPDAVLAALRELEDAGYLVRHQSRDEKGRMSSMVFEIYEKPQTGLPDTEKPHTEKPDTDNPFTGKPCTENPAQLNTNQVITNERNNSLRNYQSINLDGMDRMDEREQYRELIRDNLEIDIRSQDRHYDLDRVNEIVEIMLDAVCSTRPTIRINGEDMPQPVVKSRFLKLDSGHIDYVLQAMNDCPSDIRNIRAYLLTALYIRAVALCVQAVEDGNEAAAEGREYDVGVPAHLHEVAPEAAEVFDEYEVYDARPGVLQHFREPGTLEVAAAIAIVLIRLDLYPAVEHDEFGQQLVLVFNAHRLVAGDVVLGLCRVRRVVNTQTAVDADLIRPVHTASRLSSATASSTLPT